MIVFNNSHFTLILEKYVVILASKVLEQRVQTLERELDAAITAAESSQKAAASRAQEVNNELENTTKVFKLYMEELRGMQEQISKRDNEIKLLEAII